MKYHGAGARNKRVYNFAAWSCSRAETIFQNVGKAAQNLMSNSKESNEERISNDSSSQINECNFKRQNECSIVGLVLPTFHVQMRSGKNSNDLNV